MDDTRKIGIGPRQPGLPSYFMYPSLHRIQIVIDISLKRSFIQYNMDISVVYKRVRYKNDVARDDIYI